MNKSEFKGKKNDKLKHKNINADKKFDVFRDNEKRLSFSKMKVEYYQALCIFSLDKTGVFHCLF